MPRQKNITKIIETVCPIVKSKLIKEIELDWKMIDLSDNGKQFIHYPYASYATDVRFQQSMRPSGSHMESKPYYSRKHELYGYKTELSVLPIGLCIKSTKHYKGSMSDIEIFRRNISWHQYALSKKSNENNGENFENMEDVTENNEEWALIADKGYQGIQNDVRAIISKKSHILEVCHYLIK